MKTTMKRSLIFAMLAFAITQFATAAGRDYYQIQTFRYSEKSQEARLDTYLKMAYLPALHRAGIKSVGVFKPIASDTAAGKQIIVWIPLTSLDQLDKLQMTLAKDAVYQSAGADVISAPYNNAAFLRKESVLLKAFQDAPNFAIPKHKTKPSERIYELRSYEGATDHLYAQKVKMFNEGGEIKLFKSLNFNALFYAEVISGDLMPNLMYMITFEDMAAHDALWSAFGSHPDWKKLSSMDEYKNTVSRIVRILLYPTDYSDL